MNIMELAWFLSGVSTVLIVEFVVLLILIWRYKR